MLIPIARDDAEIRRHAWVCYAIFALNIVLFIIMGFVESDAVKLAERRWQEAIEYHTAHPYLQTPVAMTRLLTAEGTAYLEEGRRSAEPVSRYQARNEQRELDRLVTAAEEARRAQPHYKFGYVPGDSSVVSTFTSMFMHAGFLHLIGNLLYLFLSGPFIEDVFGRPLFAVLYFGGGIAATFAHELRDPESMIPAVGASGAIAAVMGAYLIRFGGSKIQFLFIPLWWRPMWNFRFWLPAFVVLPLWFGQQLLGMRYEAESDVGFSAHIGGFVFGLVFALVMKFSNYEETHVNPAVVKETTWSLDERLVRAMEARRFGNMDLARSEVASVLRDGGGGFEALQLAMDLAREVEDEAAFDAAAARLLAYRVEQKEPELAEELIFEVTNGQFTNIPKFLARAAAFVERTGDRERALTFYERLYELDPNGAGAVSTLMKIGALRRLNGDFRGAREALTSARQHPACTTEWIPSIDAKLAQLG